MPLWFSYDMEYWKPEHPPPTTPIRSPAGTGSWVAIISFTLAIADGVRLTGAPGFGAPVTTSGVTVAVDIDNLLWTLASSVYATKLVAASKLMRTPWMWPASPRMQRPQFILHRCAGSRRPIHMNPLSAVVRLFVNIFGITQPAPEAEARAGRVIGLMLVGVLAVLVAAGLLLRTVISH